MESAKNSLRVKETDAGGRIINNTSIPIDISKVSDMQLMSGYSEEREMGQDDREREGIEAVRQCFQLVHINAGDVRQLCFKQSVRHMATPLSCSKQTPQT